ncbi:MAG: NAD-dependent epimerase/dehydratase family protein [Cyclobacteriaceae bacterium]|nr:NAD-dependent epimerase/dehydratase family protein [Cyclobacteriaceae bacterium]
MRILVTGGAGYIGTALVERLAESSTVSKVVIYDNLSRGNYNLFLGENLSETSNISLVQGDILDTRSLKKSMKDIDIVYHLAARVTTPYANLDPHIYEQVNHWGTAEVVSAVEESGVKQLVYLSSTSVYGASDKQATETTAPNPKTFYGNSKLRAEKHVERLVDKDRAVIIRAGNVYGFNQSMRFDAVINRFAFEANFSKKISIQGSGKQSRAFVHIDAISQVLSELPFKELPSDTYNFAISNYSVLDLVDVFKELIPDLEFIFVDQHQELRNFELDINLKVAQFIDLPKAGELKDELSEFLGKFSF